MKIIFKRTTPTYRNQLTTQQVMIYLTATLVVVSLFSVGYYFTLGSDYGIKALLMIIASVVAAYLCEVGYFYLLKEKDINVYKNLVKLYLDNWIRNLPVRYTLTLAELYQVIMNSYDDSIENCIITRPTEDIKGSSSSVIIPEVIEVGEINA